MLRFNQLFLGSVLFSALTGLALAAIYCLALAILVLVGAGVASDLLDMLMVVFAFVFVATGAFCYCAFWAWPLLRRFFPKFTLRQEGYAILGAAAFVTNFLMFIFTENHSLWPVMLNLITTVAGIFVGSRIYELVWEKLSQLPNKSHAG